MIESLYIKNYAIIEELKMQFSDKLTIITGETGAGKSILLGALGLILGNRADLSTLHDENEKCIIEGVFTVGSYDLDAFFAENDLDYYEECIIRREIIPSGKSRAFVNDTPVNLKVLQNLAAALVDIHQQFDTLDIHEVNYQLRILDALAGQKKLVEEYRQQYGHLVEKKNELSSREERLNQAQQEREFLQFQLDELQELDAKHGEEEELEKELKLLENAESIKRILSGFADQVESSQLPVSDQLNAFYREMDSLRNIKEDIDALYERLGSVIIELRDMAQEAQNLAEDTEFDAGRQEAINDRLDQLFQILNKHKLQSSEELIAFQEEIEQKLKDTSHLEEDITNLREEIKGLESQLWQTARKIQSGRKEVVKPFTDKVENMLAQLAMPHAQLKLELREYDTLTPSGIDDVRFLFSANKGGTPKPLKDVASGGEMSRLALCIKSLVADAIPLPTLIFDEIDTGISGEVARKMGQILKELAARHQVMAITHTPQIAVCAHKHYFVYKEVAKERTLTKVKALESDDRIVAIATMLSGDPPSKSAIENARELLSS